MSLAVWLARAWGPLCFAAIAALGLVNLWQTSRTVAGTGPFSPPDSIEETDQRVEAMRQSLLYRTAVGDRGNHRAVREPVGFIATGHGERSSPAWMSVLVIVTLPGFVLAAPNAHADVPLGCFFAGAGAAAVIGWQGPGARGPLLLAGSLTGLAAWTKNEGLLFCVVFTIVCAALAWRSKRLRHFGIFAFGLAVALVPVVTHKLWWAPPNDIMTHVGGRWWEQVTDHARHATVGATFLRDAAGFTGGRIRCIR